MAFWRFSLSVLSDIVSTSQVEATTSRHTATTANAPLTDRRRIGNFYLQNRWSTPLKQELLEGTETPRLSLGLGWRAAPAFSPAEATELEPVCPHPPTVDAPVV